MAPETPPPPREQEQSIKARKTELYEAQAAQTGPRKAFARHLAETPAAPLSKYEKGVIWGAGAVVVLLLLAAIVTIPPPPKKIRVYKTAAPHAAGPQPSSPDAAKAAAPAPGPGEVKGGSPEKAKAASPERAKADPSKK